MKGCLKSVARAFLVFSLSVLFLFIPGQAIAWTSSYDSYSYDWNWSYDYSYDYDYTNYYDYTDYYTYDYTYDYTEDYSDYDYSDYYDSGDDDMDDVDDDYEYEYENPGPFYCTCESVDESGNGTDCHSCG